MARLLPIYLDAVVSIEIESKPGEKRPIATGFLFGGGTGDKDADGNNLYNVFLVTNRHVFQNPLTEEYLKKVHLRFNTEADRSSRYYEAELLDKDGQPIWIRHENEEVDIAVLSVDGKALRAEGVSFFFFGDDQTCYLMRNRAESGVATGDAIFVLGFPMGIRGEARNAAIARKGIIARVDEELLKDHYFYADVSAYPGNSGGPVIVEAELMAVGGTKPVAQTRLIGVVSKGVAYREVAVSEQTGLPRIIFEEQTGLVRVVPIDSVIETIETYLEKRKAAPSEKVPETPA